MGRRRWGHEELPIPIRGRESRPSIGGSECKVRGERGGSGFGKKVVLS